MANDAFKSLEDALANLETASPRAAKQAERAMENVTGMLSQLQAMYGNMAHIMASDASISAKAAKEMGQNVDLMARGLQESSEDMAKNLLTLVKTGKMSREELDTIAQGIREFTGGRVKIRELIDFQAIRKQGSYTSDQLDLLQKSLAGTFEHVSQAGREFEKLGSISNITNDILDDAPPIVRDAINNIREFGDTTKKTITDTLGLTSTLEVLKMKMRGVAAEGGMMDKGLQKVGFQMTDVKRLAGSAGAKIALIGGLAFKQARQGAELADEMWGQYGFTVQETSHYYKEYAKSVASSMKMQKDSNLIALQTGQSLEDVQSLMKSIASDYGPTSYNELLKLTKTIAYHGKALRLTNQEMVAIAEDSYRRLGMSGGEVIKQFEDMQGMVHVVAGDLKDKGILIPIETMSKDMADMLKNNVKFGQNSKAILGTYTNLVKRFAELGDSGQVATERAKELANVLYGKQLPDIFGVQVGAALTKGIAEKFDFKLDLTKSYGEQLKQVRGEVTKFAEQGFVEYHKTQGLAGAELDKAVADSMATFKETSAGPLAEVIRSIKASGGRATVAQMKLMTELTKTIPGFGKSLAGESGDVVKQIANTIRRTGGSIEVIQGLFGDIDEMTALRMGELAKTDAGQEELYKMLAAGAEASDKKIKGAATAAEKAARKPRAAAAAALKPIDAIQKLVGVISGDLGTVVTLLTTMQAFQAMGGMWRVGGAKGILSKITRFGLGTQMRGGAMMARGGLAAKAGGRLIGGAGRVATTVGGLGAVSGAAVAAAGVGGFMLGKTLEEKYGKTWSKKIWGMFNEPLKLSKEIEERKTQARMKELQYLIDMGKADDADRAELNRLKREQADKDAKKLRQEFKRAQVEKERKEKIAKLTEEYGEEDLALLHMKIEQQQEYAQKVIDALSGREDLSKQEQEKLDRAKRTLAKGSAETQIAKIMAAQEGKEIPAAQVGGYVAEPGIAFVHPGELIVPPDALSGLETAASFLTGAARAGAPVVGAPRATAGGAGPAVRGGGRAAVRPGDLEGIARFNAVTGEMTIVVRNFGDQVIGNYLKAAQSMEANNIFGGTKYTGG